MQVILKYTGYLKDICQKESETIENLANTKEIKPHLLKKYPPLDSVNFGISVNHRLCNTAHVDLHDNDTVYLLCPFAGG